MWQARQARPGFICEEPWSPRVQVMPLEQITADVPASTASLVGPASIPISPPPPPDAGPLDISVPLQPTRTRIDTRMRPPAPPPAATVPPLLPRRPHDRPARPDAVDL